MRHGSFEKTEHTADIGLRLTAPSLAELFCVAAEGLCALWGVRAPTTGGEPGTVSVRGEDHAALLIAWLNELIYRAGAEGRIPGTVRDAHVGRGEFRARVVWHNVEWSSSRNGLDVKAATYHGLHVDATADGWTATVIFDV